MQRQHQTQDLIPYQQRLQEYDLGELQQALAPIARTLKSRDPVIALLEDHP